MSTDPGMSRRVTRLENDTESIDDLLTGVRTTLDDHTRRFEVLQTRFDGLEGRFDGVEETLREVVRRLPEPS
ncbi:hypothetical protein LRP67_10065 [Nocardioides sp. cx-169]|uniref:hypothetical protein n=1 Tax=Nocardioides sp. cx-169 TaxID=2899080 RepID=UPI001E2C4B59|nr:hypothetical protein [Nocardioides sp. cx-169]MCD4534427.1 hypothetical protein [Nocardioides sp. cx-169]